MRRKSILASYKYLTGKDTIVGECIDLMILKVAVNSKNKYLNIVKNRRFCEIKKCKHIKFQIRVIFFIHFIILLCIILLYEQFKKKYFISLVVQYTLLRIHCFDRAPRDVASALFRGIGDVQIWNPPSLALKNKSASCYVTAIS